LVPNTKPFCTSLYVSKIIWNESVLLSELSRRASATMMPSGLLS